MRDRYVAMAPLGELARAGDAAAATRVAEALAHDADWPVRLRAAEVATGVAQAQVALLARVPRSRAPRPRGRPAGDGRLAHPRRDRRGAGSPSRATVGPS